MKPDAIRLVHLSDVHFGHEDKAALEQVADFTNHVKPDAVILAGDITQRGRKSEFEAAREWLWSLKFPVIAAPGNHDTPLTNMTARVLGPFDRYARYMEGMDAVGKLIELRDGAVRIAAINSARGVQSRLNWADGVIDLEDLETALELLAGGPEDAWRLLICHHPLDEPGLSQVAVVTKRGVDALKLCARAHVDAILTGHIHDAFAHAITNTRRPMVQMGSGTLSTRLRATPPSFCVLQMEDGRMTQDVVSIELNGLSVRRNYDSAIALQRPNDGTQAPGIR
jgi:3',5'-cyclic AMP phosphodiesterase CpdA